MSKMWGLMHCGTHPCVEPMSQRKTFQMLDDDEQASILDFHDQVAQKWLWWSEADAKGQHLLMKSHLYDMVKALKARHQDAAFLSVGREPLDMICSALPFMACIGKPEAGLPRRDEWPYVCRQVVQQYVDYTRTELEFTQSGVKGQPPLVLAVPFKEMITQPSSVMEKVYAYRQAVWGTTPEKYKGSAHEAAFEAEEQDPEEVENKAWRKSLKKKYPTMKHERLFALLDKAADQGLPRIDTDKEFAAYRDKTVAWTPVATNPAATTTHDI